MSACFAKFTIAIDASILNRCASRRHTTAADDIIFEMHKTFVQVARAEHRGKRSGRTETRRTAVGRALSTTLEFHFLIAVGAGARFARVTLLQALLSHGRWHTVQAASSYVTIWKLIILIFWYFNKYTIKSHLQSLLGNSPSNPRKMCTASASTRLADRDNSHPPSSRTYSKSPTPPRPPRCNSFRPRTTRTVRETRNSPSERCRDRHTHAQQHCWQFSRRTRPNSFGTPATVWWPLRRNTTACRLSGIVGNAEN